MVEFSSMEFGGVEFSSMEMWGLVLLNRVMEVCERASEQCNPGWN